VSSYSLASSPAHSAALERRGGLAVTMLLSYQHRITSSTSCSTRTSLVRLGCACPGRRRPRGDPPREAGIRGPTAGSRRASLARWRIARAAQCGRSGCAPLPGRKRVQRRQVAGRTGASTAAGTSSIAGSCRLPRSRAEDRLLAHYTLSGLPAILLAVPAARRARLADRRRGGAAARTSRPRGERRGPGDLQPLPDSAPPWRSARWWSD